MSAQHGHLFRTQRISRRTLLALGLGASVVPLTGCRSQARFAYAGTQGIFLHEQQRSRQVGPAVEDPVTTSLRWSPDGRYLSAITTSLSAGEQRTTPWLYDLEADRGLAPDQAYTQAVFGADRLICLDASGPADHTLWSQPLPDGAPTPLPLGRPAAGQQVQLVGHSDDGPVLAATAESGLAFEGPEEIVTLQESGDLRLELTTQGNKAVRPAPTSGPQGQLAWVVGERLGPCADQERIQVFSPTRRQTHEYAHPSDSTNWVVLDHAWIGGQGRAIGGRALPDGGSLVSVQMSYGDVDAEGSCTFDTPTVFESTSGSPWRPLWSQDRLTQVRARGDRYLYILSDLGQPGELWLRHNDDQERIATGVLAMEWAR